MTQDTYNIMLILFLLGRLIFGAYWLMTAYRHLIKGASMIGYAQSQGVRQAKLAVYGTGMLALIGGLSILFGIYIHLGILCLVIFLLGVSFKMHAYWKIQDPSMKMNQRINFEKNMALVGALLIIFFSHGIWVWGL